jgi:hypothetical protein
MTTNHNATRLHRLRSFGEDGSLCLRRKPNERVVWSGVNGETVFAQPVSISLNCFGEGERKMKALMSASIFAVLLVAISADSASASCCGAASYTNCGGDDPATYCCAKQHCHTVMKTCRKTVWEKQEYTCYKKCYETVYEQKTIDCVKYCRETHYRECQYTVCKPVYETRYRTCNYTVCKPV